jgi:N-acetylglutamate synthase-like GNAT family acetyltransferase
MNDIIGFILSKTDEMQCDGLTRSEIEAGVSDGSVIIEQFEDGFVVLQPEGHLETDPCSYIWMLWIKPEKRGTSAGRRIVKEILKKYRINYQMRVKCYGASRAKFFARCGFKIDSRNGEMREMVTWRIDN